MVKIVSIVGARPQFIKLAPICKAANDCKKKLQHIIIHTGQHYDFKMSKIFFRDLGIPNPNYHLNVGSGSHGAQTAKMLERIEKILKKENPDWVVVYGDTNSTLAGALASRKLHMRVAHIEAGLRSYNRKMPEEINRVLTDQCSDILFCPTQTAIDNLKKEGFQNIINGGRLTSQMGSKFGNSDKKYPLVVNVGDVMYDALLLSLRIAKKKSRIMAQLKLRPQKYHLATLHRAENTDHKGPLSQIITALSQISQDLPVLVPMHPRTRRRLAEFNIPLAATQLRIIDPVGYFDMLMLEKNAKTILTDSGGIQKEAYLLKTRCITFRDETEWKETLKHGWNQLTGANRSVIVNAVHSPKKRSQNHADFLGKGDSATRIVSILVNSHI